VTLHTQKAGTNMGVVWESLGDGSYSVDEVPRPEGTGTTITLTLKKFEEEDHVADFSDEWTLKSLVKKYSDFISKHTNHGLQLLGAHSLDQLVKNKSYLKSFG